MAQFTIEDLLSRMTPPERMPSPYAQAKADVAAFNANPRAYSDDQKMDIVARAKQLGLDYSEGKSKDKATGTEKAVAFGGGALDSLLFGVLKDKWYSDYRTEKYKNAGKLTGTAASFLIPMGSLGVAGRLLGGAGKGAKGMLGTAKALTSYGRLTQEATQIGKVAKKAVSFKQMIEKVNAARQMATAAEYAKAAQQLRIAMTAGQNAGFEDGQQPYENPQYLQQYLQSLPGYQQQSLGN